MNFIIFLLIFFFLLLILFSFFSASTQKIYPVPWSVYEGMDSSGNTTDTSTTTSTNYQDYSPNDALILSQQNSGNIEYLKGRVDDIGTSNDKIVQHIFDISNNLTVLNDQVNTIVEQQAQYAQSVLPESIPPMDLSMPDDSATTTPSSDISNTTNTISTNT